MILNKKQIWCHLDFQKNLQYITCMRKIIGDHKYERANNIAMGTIPKTKTTRIQNIKSNIGRFFYLEV